MVLFEDNLLAVRNLSPDDYPLLVRWLNDSRILQFYEGGPSHAKGIRTLPHVKHFNFNN